MKKVIYIIVSIIILALLGIWLFSNKKISEKKVYHYNKSEAILISTDTASLRYLSGEILYTGTFEPFREGKVMAESQGKIIIMNAELGDKIKAGQIVAKLDNDLLKLQLEVNNIQIEGFEKDVNRYTILAKADAVQGIQLEKTLLALKTADVQRKTLQEQINKTIITAPFSGVVTQKFIEIGTVIAPSVPIIQLTDINTLKLTFTIPESDIKYFHLNQSLSVWSTISPDKSIPGKVVMIGSRGDIAHNFPVQILIANTSNQQIKAGMFGSVKMITGQNQDYITIPIKALFGSSLKQQVYVVEKGKAIARNIIVAFQNEKYAAISSGLTQGEIVVVSGFINLKNGSPVKSY